MSRALPAHPNLDHLRKQAKELLDELQTRRPDSKLADAQRAIAREYGFASWTKLKAHVESLPRPASPAAALVSEQPRGGGGGKGGGAAVNAADHPAPDYGFDRYTPTARQALFFSRYEAGRLGNESIETAHLLLGLIRASQKLARHVFARAHISLEATRAEVAALTVAREMLPTSVEIPFSAETRQVLLKAAEEADRLQHHRIGTTHLLAGIRREEGSVGASILRAKGVRLDTLRHELALPPDEG